MRSGAPGYDTIVDLYGKRACDGDAFRPDTKTVTDVAAWRIAE